MSPSEEYKGCYVIQSDFVLPQTDPDESSAERVPADYDDYGDYDGDVMTLPAVPIRNPSCCAPAQFRPLNVLRRRFWDTADCSPADVAPVACLDPIPVRLIFFHVRFAI